MELRHILEEIKNKKISEEGGVARIQQWRARRAEHVAHNGAEEKIPFPERPAPRAGDQRCLSADELERYLIADLKATLMDILNVEKDDLDVSLPLSEFGMDSILASELIASVRDRYNLVLPPTILFEFKSVRDFAAYLARKHGKHIRSRLVRRSPESEIDTHVLKKDVMERGGSAVTLPPSNASVNKSREQAQATAAGAQSLETLWDQEEALLNTPNQGGGEAPCFAAPASVAQEAGLPNARSILISGAEKKAVEIIDVGAGPPLLLIGGLGTPASVWGYQVEAFAKEYRMLIYHPPGHGRRDEPLHPFTFATMAEEIVWALDALTIKEPVPVVGWSLGGSLGLILTLLFPHHVQGLFLANTTACSVGVETPSREQNMADILSSAKKEVWLEMMSGETLLAAKVLTRYRALFSEFDIREQLGTIRVPVSVLAGGRDGYMRPAYGQGISSQVAEGSFSEIKQAGHVSLLTHAEQFNHVLRDFLQGLTECAVDAERTDPRVAIP